MQPDVMGSGRKLFEDEFANTAFDCWSGRCRILKTRLMSDLHAKDPFQFAGHCGDEIEIVDHQIVLFNRQIFDVFPKLQGVELLNHFFVVQSTAVAIEQTDSLAAIFYGKFYGEVCIVSAEHNIYLSERLQ